jgi:uncharacterized membrane protein
MAFPALAFVFGLLFYTAASALATLSPDAMGGGWLWWLALIPLAVCHAVAGFIATSATSHSIDGQFRGSVLCALTSGATSLFTLFVAIGCARAVPLRLSPTLAVSVVAISLLAAVAGLALAMRLSHRSVAQLSRRSKN